MALGEKYKSSSHIYKIELILSMDGYLEGIKKIARPTTGAKGYYFLDIFLQIFHVFITHFNVSKKYLSNI